MKIFSGIVYFFMDILETIVFVGAIFIVIYLFIIQPSQVQGASMEPSFTSGDRIFVSKVAYKIDAPRRGDIVVFRSPKNKEREYIKRIIATPGDTVRIKDCAGPEQTLCEIYVNGRLVTERYIKEKTPIFYNSLYNENEEVKVPDRKLFVMGDNRPGSEDSRAFGPIPYSDVIGKVFLRYFPFSAAGLINNPNL